MPAGRVAMDGGLAQLEWSGEVVAAKLPVAALHYPPEPGLQAARGRAFEGLQGFLADTVSTLSQTGQASPSTSVALKSSIVLSRERCSVPSRA